MIDFNFFDKIWEKTVVPTCKDFLKQYKNEEHFVFVDHIKKSKNKARRIFKNESNIFIYSYMVDKTRNIDRHKIASCMMKSILLSKPLRISFIDKIKKVFKMIEIDDSIHLINQYIAVNVAVLILEGYIASDKRKDIKHKIHFPEPFPDGEKDYIKDVCLDLYYTNSKRFNIITYANILFLWEKYSCRRVQCENLQKFIYDTNKTNPKQLDSIRLTSEEGCERAPTDIKLANELVDNMKNNTNIKQEN